MCFVAFNRDRRKEFSDIESDNLPRSRLDYRISRRIECSDGLLGSTMLTELEVVAEQVQ